MCVCVKNLSCLHMYGVYVFSDEYVLSVCVFTCVDKRNTYLRCHFLGADQFF